MSRFFAISTTLFAATLMIAAVSPAQGQSSSLYTATPVAPQVNKQNH